MSMLGKHKASCPIVQTGMMMVKDISFQGSGRVTFKVYAIIR